MRVPIAVANMNAAAVVHLPGNSTKPVQHKLVLRFRAAISQVPIRRTGPLPPDHPFHFPAVDSDIDTGRLIPFTLGAPMCNPRVTKYFLKPLAEKAERYPQTLTLTLPLALHTTSTPYPCPDAE